MLVELVRTTTADGLRLDGALSVPAGGASLRPGVLLSGPAFSGRCDVLLALHGVGSNFYSGGLFEEVLPPLLAAGLPMLRVNTRGHDGLFLASSLRNRFQFGAAFEVVDECRTDLSAWLEFLAGRGYERVGLFGHSLGAVKAVYSQAVEPHPLVRCLVAASPPRLASSCYLAGPERERFEPLLCEAEQHVAAGRGDTLMRVRFPAPLVISASTYLDKYGRENRYDVLAHAPRLPCPALFTYGETELQTGGSPFAKLPERLAELTYAGPRPQVATLAGADHFYTGCRRELAAEALRWLRASEDCSGRP